MRKEQKEGGGGGKGRGEEDEGGEEKEEYKVIGMRCRKNRHTNVVGNGYCKLKFVIVFD